MITKNVVCANYFFSSFGVSGLLGSGSALECRLHLLGFMTHVIFDNDMSFRSSLITTKTKPNAQFLVLRMPSVNNDFEIIWK